MIHCWIQEPDSGYLESLRQGLGLKSLVYTRIKQGPGPARLGVMIGAKEALLREAAQVWDKPGSNPGPQLGYPSCCSELYCRRLAEAQSSATDLDVVHQSYSNTKPPGHRLSFLLNDVFYLYSRAPAPGHSELREKLYGKNPGLPMSVLNVIPWHPCSYRCRSSLAKARKIWALMQTLVPPLAAILKSCLSKPVLFWDWHRFIVLRGSCDKNGSCRYSSIQPPFSLIEPDIVSLLQSGNRLSAHRDRMQVWRDSRRMGEFKAPLLLDFSA